MLAKVESARVASCALDPQKRIFGRSSNGSHVTSSSVSSCPAKHSIFAQSRQEQPRPYGLQTTETGKRGLVVGARLWHACVVREAGSTSTSGRSVTQILQLSSRTLRGARRGSDKWLLPPSLTRFGPRSDASAVAEARAAASRSLGINSLDKRLKGTARENTSYTCYRVRNI